MKNLNAFFKKENIKKTHSFPIGAMVKLKNVYEDSSLDNTLFKNGLINGQIGYIVSHIRDCNEEPLYVLSSVMPLCFDNETFDIDQYIIKNVIPEEVINVLTEKEFHILFLKIKDTMVASGYSEKSLNLVF